MNRADEDRLRPVLCEEALGRGQGLRRVAAETGPSARAARGRRSARSSSRRCHRRSPPRRRPRSPRRSSTGGAPAGQDRRGDQRVSPGNGTPADSIATAASRKTITARTRPAGASRRASVRRREVASRADECRHSEGDRCPASAAWRSCRRRSAGSVRASRSIVEAGAGSRSGILGRRVPRGRRDDRRSVERGGRRQGRGRRPVDEVARFASGQVADRLPAAADRRGGRRAAARPRACMAFALESIPRITRAQPMDALSSQATVCGLQGRADRRRPPAALLADADDRGRHDPAREGARARRRRRRAAGDRDRAPARRSRVGLRRAPGRPRAGRVARRDVPRPRRGRRGDRGRLRAGADAGAAGRSSRPSCRRASRSSTS